MDADGNLIPIVEGDQGEGFKDPLTQAEMEEIYLEEWLLELEKKLERMKWRDEEKLRRKTKLPHR